MGWGDAFKAAYDAATDMAKSAADTAMSSAREASAMVGRVAQAAADKAVAAAKGVANVAGFAGRAASEAAGLATAQVVKAGAAITAPFRAADKVMATKEKPEAVEGCADCWAAKKKRLEKRDQVIKKGRDSADPAVVAAANRLDMNNQAVELAKLSSDTYKQYPTPTVADGNYTYPTPGAVPAPPGWKVMPAGKLGEDTTKALVDARAVVYQTEANWPGGQKTVLAFRGTDSGDDVLTDYDQAMALATTQYDGAKTAGIAVAKQLGDDVLVTGHSLGGGKAQAAGAVASLKGMMFNSAGLNPATVDGAMPSATQFEQYRNSGDPLTGAQNSALTQVVTAGAAAVAMPFAALLKAGNAASGARGGPTLSDQTADYADKAMKALPRGLSNLVKDGNVLPPAVGPIHVVTALTDDGEVAPTLGDGLKSLSASAAGKAAKAQHSITNLVNGIEQQKRQDVATITG